MINPLQAWQVVILSPRLDDYLARWIASQGGTPIHLPMIAIDPLIISQDTLSQWQRALAQSSYLLIASQNAIYAAPAELLQTIGQLSALKIITMGQATTLAATRAGFTVFHTPPPGTTSEILLQESFLQTKSLQGKTVALLAGEGGRVLIAQTLSARGALVHWCRVYRQTKTTPTLEPLFNPWPQANKHCFIATSLNMLENLLSATPDTSKAWLLQQIFIVASDRIAQQAKKWEIQHVLIAQGADTNSLVQALQEIGKVCNTAS